jgi:hypothetical protein
MSTFEIHIRLSTAIRNASQIRDELSAGHLSFARRLSSFP